MTLRKKLVEKRNHAVANAIKTSEKLWNCICSEFESLTGRQLKEGNVAYIELEQNKEQLCLKKYVSDERFNDLLAGEICIEIDSEWLETKEFDSIMQEVKKMAETEEVELRKLEDDPQDSYSSWWFEISLK